MEVGSPSLRMDNVLTDMVQRLRAIELLLRTQNELLSKMIAEWNRSDHPTLALEQDPSNVHFSSWKKAAAPKRDGPL